MVKTMRAERPIAGNSIQITGGEPMLREDITDLISIIKEEGVDHIQMNTNGIRHALDPESAREVRLSGCNNLYLSFDGVTARTNPKNHWEIPHALDSCRKTGTTVVFVPTVIKSINDHELGGIVRYAQKNMDVVHAVNFQPVLFYTSHQTALYGIAHLHLQDLLILQVEWVNKLRENKSIEFNGNSRLQHNA